MLLSYSIPSICSLFFEFQSVFPVPLMCSWIPQSLIPTITGAVRCTRTYWLPVLSNISPADIRRDVATSRTILRAPDKPELPLLADIDSHLRPRLKSRRPIWSNLPDEAPTIQQLWRTQWQNQIVDVPNKSLINDPTIQLPGWTCPVANGAC